MYLKPCQSKPVAYNSYIYIYNTFDRHRYSVMSMSFKLFIFKMLKMIAEKSFALFESSQSNKSN